jgi:hypothetical protein
MNPIQLNELIDFKQKFSNILEARWARSMAEEASRQGNTLLVFTIVTIIFVSPFLPLSCYDISIGSHTTNYDRTSCPSHSWPHSSRSTSLSFPRRILGWSLVSFPSTFVSRYVHLLPCENALMQENFCSWNLGSRCCSTSPFGVECQQSHPR